MNKVKFLVAALMGVFFTACSEEENLTQTGKTGFLVSLAEDVKVESRSTPEELGEPVASQFNLKITNQATGSELYNDSYTNQLIPASAGTYAIEATQGDNPVLALDAPYYKGTAEADLADGESKTVQVNCKVANALASVTFDNSGTYRFDEQFSSYGVRVTLPDASTVITDNGKSAYYQAGSKPVFVFEGKTDNQTVEVPLDNSEFSKDSTFAAGAHCIISLKLGATSSGVRVEIAKVEVQEVTINETIPMEWLPKPKVTATGFGSNNTLSFVETETPEAKLSLNLSSALQDIKFKFNFEDEQFAFEDREYLLSTDKETIEQALDVTLPSVGDKPESIDLGGLIAKLQTNAGVPTNNSIEIDVQANNRWSSEDAEANRVYTLTCNKPEFSIAVQPGNVWTKTFTIDEPVITAGNADVLNEKLVYQYKEKNAGDDAWQTCSDGLEQVFAEHPANKEYEVRAFYREGIVSNVVDIILEIPAQLPNSDMEDWYSEDVGGTIRSYYPWASNETSFWNTNNDYTTRYRIWGSIAGYNCFPAVSYVSGRNGGGKAAELRNTASGRYNTSSIFGHNEHDYNKVAGELFIGDITVNEESYEISTKGKDFNSRPTALQFYYKYDPYNGNDTWKVHFELLDENRETIISKEVTSSEVKDDYGDIPMSVEFDYEEGKTYAKCKYIYVVFSSTINTGSSLPYGNVTYYLLENGESLKYSNVYVGSILTIDDISLVYDK